MTVDELWRRLGREPTAAEYIEAQERARWRRDHPEDEPPEGEP